MSIVKVIVNGEAVQHDWQEDFKNDLNLYTDETGASIGAAKAWLSGHWLGIQIGLSLDGASAPTVPSNDSDFKHVCYVLKSANTKLYNALEKCITPGTQANITAAIGSGVTNATNHAFRTRITYYTAEHNTGGHAEEAISFATTYLKTEYSNRTLYLMVYIP